MLIAGIATVLRQLHPKVAHRLLELLAAYSRAAYFKTGDGGSQGDGARAVILAEGLAAHLGAQDAYFEMFGSLM